MSSQILTRALNKLKITKDKKPILRVVRATLGPSKFLTVLPTELIIRILTYLEAAELLFVRLICSQLRLIIDTVHEIQYIIYLTLSGNRNNNANRSMVVQERLDLLKSWQVSWKRPVVTQGCKFRLDTDAQGLRQFGGVFSRSHIFLRPTRNGMSSDSRSWNGMECLSMECSQAAADTRTVSFDLPFETFTLDMSHTRLVLLHWARRRPTTEDWTYKIRVVNLKDGQVLYGGTVEVAAPRRDFEEAPAVEIQGDMVGVAAGALFSDAANPDRALHVALVDMSNGLSQSYTRRCQRGLEYNSASFMFSSDSSFLLAVKHDGFFAVEGYAIAPMSVGKKATPSHIATFQFPALRKGCSSTGAPNSFSKAETGGALWNSQPFPFTPTSDSILVSINRLYFGPSSSIHLNCFVHLSLFSSAIARFRTSSQLPVVLPWTQWGQSSTRCFVDKSGAHAAVMRAYGCRVLLDKFVFDFAQKDISRDLGLADEQGGLKINNGRSAARRTGRGPSLTTDDGVVIQRYPGRVHTQPTVIPREGVFVDDVVTSLPYRRTEIDVGILQSGLPLTHGSFWGDVWLVSSLTTPDNQTVSTLICPQIVIRAPQES